MIAPKRMSSGKYIDLANLTVDDVDVYDISRALNYIYRFTGHWKDHEPLTVAQHSVLVLKLAYLLYPDDRSVHKDALIHDFSEAYYGDVATPLKNILKKGYREFASKVDQVVYAKVWPDHPVGEEYDEVHLRTKICDLTALDIERRMLWKSTKGKEMWPTGHVEIKKTEREELFTEVSKQRIIDLETYYKEIFNG